MNKTNSMLLIATLAVFILSPILAFRTAYLTEIYGPLPSTSAVLLEATPGDTQTAKLIEELYDFAQTRELELAIEDTSPDVPESHSVYFTTTARQKSSEPSFLRNRTIVVNPLSEIKPESLNGVIQINQAAKNGDEPDGELQSILTSQGYQATTMRNGALNIYLDKTNILLTALLVLMPAISIIGHIFTNTRADGVFRLLGKSAHEQFAAAIANEKNTLLASAVITVAVTISSLGIYNGYHRSGGFLRLTVLCVALGLITLYLTYLVGHRITRVIGIPEAIKDAIPGRTFLSIALVSKIIVYSFALFAVASVVQAQIAYNEASKDASFWANNEEISRMKIKGGADETKLISETRKQERLGNIILSATDLFASTDATEPRVVLVSKEFTDRYLNSAARKVITPESINVLFPGEFDSATFNKVTTFFDQERQRGGQYPQHIVYHDKVDLEQVPTLNPDEHALIDSPVVTVIDGDISALSDNTLAAFLTGTEILTATSEIADIIRTADAESAATVAQIKPLASEYFATKTRLSIQANESLLATTCLTFLLFVCIFLLATSFAKSNSSKIFANYLLGRTSWRYCRILYFGELIFAAVTVLFIGRGLSRHVQLESINAPELYTYYSGSITHNAIIAGPVVVLLFSFAVSTTLHAITINREISRL